MNKKTLFFLIGLILSVSLQGQNRATDFKAISSSEKWWVFWHPFKAKRAWKTSQNALQVTDSLKASNTIGRDLNGGHLDAFKHSFWMASLSTEIGVKPAIKLGEAHEKGNYKTFLKGDKEDGTLPDKPSSDMDLFNNQVGASIAIDFPNASQDELIGLVLDRLQNGSLRIIKKNKDIFLTCSGQPIQAAMLNERWENNKCLIPSNDP